ncbi:MAG TPA: DUF3037 domain-containing protein [Egibacteraceae bacterium]|nr:DUF3037 domain-containing protein [Egibacteraceae bacterium]
MSPYEWTVLRVVPRVERCEFVNAGVVVYCQQLDFLQAAVALDERRLRALDPEVDVATVRRHLDAVRRLCAGDPDAGANAARPQGERFRWLASPRSTVVQCAPVHTGVTTSPADELTRLLDTMVRLPAE